MYQLTVRYTDLQRCLTAAVAPPIPQNIISFASHAPTFYMSSRLGYISCLLILLPIFSFQLIHSRFGCYRHALQVPTEEEKKLVFIAVGFLGSL
jgi:hypothetical protein